MRRKCTLLRLAPSVMFCIRLAIIPRAKERLHASQPARHRTRMPRLELFPFRLRDPVSGRWVRARYVAERHEIEKRYAEWKIVGPAEIRNVEPSAAFQSVTERAPADAATALSNHRGVAGIGRNDVGRDHLLFLRGHPARAKPRSSQMCRVGEPRQYAASRTSTPCTHCRSARHRFATVTASLRCASLFHCASHTGGFAIVFREVF